jgi:hypothetical protein
MSKERTAWLLALVLLATLGCGTDDREAVESAGPEDEMSEVDRAEAAASEAYAEAETPEDKLAVVRSFLAEYPESEHTANAVSAGVYLLTEELDRPEEAYELVNGTLAVLEDPEVVHEVRMELADLHARTGRVDELAELVGTIEAERDLLFTDHYRFMEIAAEAEAWDLLRDQAEAGTAFATAAAYQAQYPEMTEAESDRGGSRRMTYCKTYEGWALANLGQHDEALAAFALAEEASDTSHALLGIDDTELSLHWGKTLALLGDHAGAMDKLAVEAVLGSEEAQDVYRECWTALHGSEEGLEDKLWALRNEHAVPLPEFTLADYDGNEVSSADFAGKVLVIATWNPG